MSARLLVDLLRDPGRAAGLDAEQWNALACAARAERLIGTLAVRILEAGLPIPAEAERILRDGLADSDREQAQALWEADRAQLALADIDAPIVLLKGTAYVAASLKAARGRFVGDLDIMVPRDALPQVEAALLAAGWEWVKEDAYDDIYYRRWMHELPPLIHRERDRMIDVHHTILPLTARPKPDAAAMLADSTLLPNGLRILNAEDRICHAAAHMIADGDLAGGLRNLWDIHCMLEEDGGDRAALLERARHHGLKDVVARAIRLADALYGSGTRMTLTDRLFVRRLLSRDGWGRDARKLTGLAFYIRSHLLRMPPLMLARHLFTKWRMGHRPV